MNKTLVVKGMGKVSVEPDLTVIGMSLTALNKQYGEAMAAASEQMESVRSALLHIGFKKSDLKTTDFNVHSRYESERDSNGNYQSVFKGFEVNHSLKLEFDFNMDKLNEVLAAVSTCKANPRFSIEFSVKDKNAVSESLLASAVHNATQKAKILAKSAGVKLGAIQNIDYSWGDLHLVSPTAYKADENRVALKCTAMDIQPDKIDVTDAVTLVWEIL